MATPMNSNTILPLFGGLLAFASLLGPAAFAEDAKAPAWTSAGELVLRDVDSTNAKRQTF